MSIFDELISKADDYLKGLCEDIYNTRGDNFANARQIRNIFENVLTAQANRLSGDEDITDDDGTWESIENEIEDLMLANDIENSNYCMENIYQYCDTARIWLIQS